MTRLKKLFISIFLSLYLLVLSLTNGPLVPAVSAQESSGSWYNQSYQEWIGKVLGSPDNEIFGERYTFAQVKWILFSIKKILSFSPDGLELCSSSGDLRGCFDFTKNFFESLSSTSYNPNVNNALAGSKKFWKILFSPGEISGIRYFVDTGNKFHLVPQVSAQEGYGFQAISPVRDLWRGVRNATFGLFVIFIVAISFMIMFRVKISPQTVITIQSALPKIAIALVLVTFSYAIAGFLVDLVYVVIGFLSAVLAQMGVNTFERVHQMMTTGALGMGVLGNLFLYTSLFVFGLTFALAGTTALASFAWPIYGLLSTVLGIVLGILLLIAYFKIIWLLFKTVANVLIQIIFAPIQIGFGAVSPAGGFGSWFKNFVSNLAIFPVVGVLFVLATHFAFLAFTTGLIHTFQNILDLPVIKQVVDLAATAVLGAPISLPETKLGAFPLLVGLSRAESADSLIFLGVSLFLIFIIPKTAEIIQAFIQGKPFAYGAAIGETTGPGISLLRGGLAGWIGKQEEAKERNVPPGRVYVPYWYTQVLRTLGIIKR